MHYGVSTPEGSSPCSQRLACGPYPETNKGTTRSGRYVKFQTVYLKKKRTLIGLVSDHAYVSVMNTSCLSLI
jgi:hypothetical protein